MFTTLVILEAEINQSADTSIQGCFLAKAATLGVAFCLTLFIVAQDMAFNNLQWVIGFLAGFVGVSPSFHPSWLYLPFHLHLTLL